MSLKVGNMADYKELLRLWNGVRLARDDGKHIPELAQGYRDSTDFAYTILHSDGETVEIYCDGTDHFIEWLEDCNCKRTGFLGCSEGFDHVSKSFFAQMRHLTEMFKKFRIVGHSRGCPIGKGIATRLKFFHDVDVEVVSFGSPKDGGKDYAEALVRLGIKVTLVQMVGDIVCDVPVNFTKDWEHFYTEKVVLKHKLDGVKDIHLGYGIALQEYIKCGK